MQRLKDFRVNGVEYSIYLHVDKAILFQGMTPVSYLPLDDETDAEELRKALERLTSGADVINLPRKIRRIS